ncbi:hypothetical protein [Streptomyces sp. NPDC037389]|uniref:hypothetical protein n=1 Tax=Streptomyces sp. NPDC037389 TaxID=3155369 RepID=UPI0033CAB8C8
MTPSAGARTSARPRPTGLLPRDFPSGRAAALGTGGRLLAVAEARHTALTGHSEHLLR